ncbi:MAG: phenylalanine--tRNA ligase subunit beta, partial [Halanaerobium sp.]|nr:phenylalanine--tRNA ligase subunit beta [Halanaerobium sp.]
LFGRLGIEEMDVRRPAKEELAEDYPFLHQGRSLVIAYPDGKLGFLGELHPEVQETWDFASRVTVFELDLDQLMVMARLQADVEDIPRYPASFRDIALVLAEDIPASKVAGVISREGGEMLVELELFDLYRGKQLPEGTRSLAYRLKFQYPDRTLQDEEVNQVLAQIVGALQDELAAEIRG